MAKKCHFKFYSQSDKECVYSPSIGSEFCIWHDSAVAKDEDFVRVRLKSAIAETGGDLEGFLLRKADLSGMNLRDVDLRDADLREANLEGADCRGADFRGAKLNRVTAANATFEGANFMAANLNDGNFKGAKFLNCNLRIVNLGHANIEDADFSGSDLRNTDFGKTEQNDNTNLVNVVGITAKIEMGDPAVAAPPAQDNSAPPVPVPPINTAPHMTEPPTTPMSTGALPGPPPTGTHVLPTGPQVPPTGPQMPSASGPVFEKDSAAADGESFFENFTSDDDEPLAAPLTKREEQPVTVDDNPDEPATGVTSATDKGSEDETDYGLAAAPEAPLTMKHSAPGKTLMRLLFPIIILAIGVAGGLALEWKTAVSVKVLGNSPAAPAAGDTAALEQKITAAETQLQQSLENAAVLQKSIDDQKEQIQSMGQKILELQQESGDGTSAETIAKLQQEKAQAVKRMAEWENKYAGLMKETEARSDQLMQLAVKNTEIKELANEIKQVNKSLVSEKRDLGERLKEAEELLNAYKTKLESSEKKREELLANTKTDQDPLLEKNPDWVRIAWDRYSISSPDLESYLLGVKFTESNDGGFITADLMMVGKLPLSKPSFKISFFDGTGNVLQKNLKYTDRKGIKFQQVKLGNTSWRNQEAKPVYFKVEFLTNE